MAKQCKSITISNCPSPNDCETCKEIINSKCIKYTAEDLTFLGVNKGDNLNQILIKLNLIVSELSGS